MNEDAKKANLLVKKTMNKRKMHQNSLQRKKRLQENTVDMKRRREKSMRRRKRENMNQVKLLEERLQRNQ